MKKTSLSAENFLRAFVDAAPLILFLPALLSGKALFWGLPATQFIPWKYFAFESLRQGILPLWNPYNGLGAPLLANYQLAFFYPPGWMSYLLAAMGGVAWLAWSETLLIGLHLCWAAAGMMALQRQLKVDLRGELITGLAFGMCGYMTARAEFFPLVIAASWLPWIVLGAERLTRHAVREAGFEGKAVKDYLFLWVCLSMQLLSGHAQVTFYTLVLAISWVIFSTLRIANYRSLARALFIFAGAVLLAVLTAAVQLLPTAEYLLNSQRAASVDASIALVYSFWPWRLLTLLFPNFFGSPGLGNYWGYANFWEDAAYIGLLPLIAALGTLFRLRDRENQKNAGLSVFLWCVVLVGFLLVLGKNTPIFPFLYEHVPTFNTFNGPARFLVWVEFALALLAGMGVAAWSRPAGRQLFWTRLAVAGSAAVSVGAFLSQYFLKGVNVTFIPSAAVAGGLGAGVALLSLFVPDNQDRKLNLKWTAAAATLVAFDLCLAGWNSNTFISTDFYTRALENRDAPQAADTQRIYIPPDSEYRIKFERFFTFKSYSIDEDWANLWTSHLPNTNLITGVGMLNNFDPLLPSRFARLTEELAKLDEGQRRSLLEALGVTRIESVSAGGVQAITAVDLQGQERYRLFGCAIGVDESKAWQELKRRLEDGRPPFEPALIEGNEINNDPSCSSNPTGSVKVMLHEPDRLVLEVDAGQNGWLQAAETYYPGWEAVIDGKTVPAYPANVIFKAIRMPSGRHSVEFIYRPISLEIGAVSSAASLIFVLFVLYLFSLKKRKNGTNIKQQESTWS